MTIEEAKKRAQPKIDAKTFDIWDLENLLNSVYQQGASEEHRYVCEEIQAHIERIK